MVEVSVVLPVHNGEATLFECIQSVLAQDYRHFEIVAVDDGSIDDSPRILSSFRTVKVVSQTNSGVSAARNRGVQVARGAYVAFIDQDDTWRTNKLELQMQAVRDCAELGYVFSDLKRVDLLTKTEFPLSNSQLNSFIYSSGRSTLASERVRVFEGFEMFELLLRGYPVYPSTMLIKRDLLQKAGGWNQAFPKCQDLDLSLRCVSLTKVAYIDETLTIIGRHDKNVSIDFLGQLEEDAIVLRSHLGRIDLTAAERSRIRYHLGRRLLGLGWHHSARRDRRRARAFYRDALRFRSSFLSASINLPLTFLPLGLRSK